jgi:hypothetical protein
MGSHHNASDLLVYLRRPPYFQPSVLKQIVEAFLALVLGIDLGAYPARAFNHVAHLEEVAEIGFFFVRDIGLDVLAALEPAVWVKKPTPPTAAQIGQAVRATVRPRHTAFNSSRTATVPTQQSFFTHHSSLE